jgi:glycoside hydrolase-like protein
MEMMRRITVTLLLLASALAVPAAAAGDVRTIHFGGEKVAVPTGWAVIRLAGRPHACVRLDRRAVYLGRPGPSQRCPAGAIGRRRAILVDPGARARAARLRARASRVPSAHISAASSYTGLGFDACTAPSRSAMSAWGASPYRAIGVYIGGLNRGCSQPNLTASWVAAEIAADWNLIPTYVGLQAPTSSCGSCAKLSASSAAAQGAAAADDAVEQAQAVAIGPGSPIYFDMESYTRTTSASSAVLAFLEAWTNQLHALGYESGVYSSGASGIADLVDELGSGYQEPDNLWSANWNGHATAADPYVPSTAWTGHRIHQYAGGHDESYGGVTINIDNNYLEGGAAGTAAGAGPKGRLEAVRSPRPGQVSVAGWAFDPSLPTAPLAIRAYVSGDGGRGVPYEFGPVASLAREDVALAHSAAGPAHGFDVSFPVIASGRRKVCVHALGVGEGSDRVLGCRTVGIRVPIAISQVKQTQRALWVNLRCQWPAGTQCPGQILLRANVRLYDTVRRGRRRVTTTRTIQARLARRTFNLSGGGSHAFSVHLSRRGHLLTRGATELRAQLLVAIPGGRKGRGLTLTPGRGLPR